MSRPIRASWFGISCLTRDKPARLLPWRRTVGWGGLVAGGASLAGNSPLNRVVMRTKKEVMPMFDLDRFKADCSSVAAESAAVQAIREVVARAVEDPRGLQKAVGEPRRSAIQKLPRSRDPTTLHLI